MSLGIRSGVNWIRAKSIAHTCAKERASSVLPSPGRSSISTWPSASRANNTNSTASRLPMIAVEQAIIGKREAVELVLFALLADDRLLHGVSHRSRQLLDVDACP